MSCIKKWALKEPLVDHTEGKCVNSNAPAILDIDIKTVKVEDLNFSVAYELKIMRDDYVHALVGWYIIHIIELRRFDVFFSKAHIPIKLSTSPYCS
jgi:protein arginine N-methyltransferase 1